tara:strand:- start:611 stop:1027 length:417 start_codon:yes stop_codon:yes gene_type:complete
MDNKNVPAMICGAIMAVSTFLPWVEVSASASFMGQSSSFSTGGISGISTTYGTIGLILGGAGAYLGMIRFPQALFVGVVGFIEGIAIMLGWISFGGSGSFSGSGYSASSSIDAMFGLYLFLAASLAYAVSSLGQLKES